MESQPMDAYQLLEPSSENESHNTGPMHVGNAHVALAPSEIEEAQDLQKFKLISDHATDGISIVDRDGRFIYVNQTLCNWAGYTQEEYLRLQLSDRDADYNQVT